MKEAVFIGILFIATFSIYLFGQDSETFVFSGVTEVPGVSHNDLFNRAYLWILDGSIDGYRDLFEANPDDGGIIFKGDFPFFLEAKITGRKRHNGIIRYRMTIYVREGRYKYVISDFEHESSAQPPRSYGTIYNSKIPELYLIYEPEEEVIEELIAAVKKLSSRHIELIKRVMESPTELETEW